MFSLGGSALLSLPHAPPSRHLERQVGVLSLPQAFPAGAGKGREVPSGGARKQGGVLPLPHAFYAGMLFFICCKLLVHAYECLVWSFWGFLLPLSLPHAPPSRHLERQGGVLSLPQAFPAGVGKGREVPEQSHTAKVQFALLSYCISIGHCLLKAM